MPLTPLTFLLTQNSTPPLPPRFLPLTQHLLLVAPGRCKMLERLGNKARGRGWSAMTVPQHNLFYLTPANASEPTTGHRRADRTHATPSLQHEDSTTTDMLFPHKTYWMAQYFLALPEALKSHPYAQWQNPSFHFFLLAQVPELAMSGVGIIRQSTLSQGMIKDMTDHKTHHI